MGLTLDISPGFSDLSDSLLVAGNPLFGIFLAHISLNAAFAMVTPEFFQGMYKSGDTVSLPVSPRDGYFYQRSELLYVWTVRNSVNPSSNMISGPDCLWFGNWDVDQSTGAVFLEEWYERSSAADSRNPAQSNDGTIHVFTIAQRQRANMIMSAPATFTAIAESDILGSGSDKPVTQDIMQHLNQNAKFACVNKEVFYLGEYVNGQTVTLPSSPVDGHSYSAAECTFIHAWRWTTLGSAYTAPPGPDEQAAPFDANVNSSGVCTVQVDFATDGGNTFRTETTFGRIAVFAFCKRSTTPSTISPTANAFTEIDLNLLFPGNDLRASEAIILKRNIDEALVSTEYFRADYADGSTVPTPVSPVDSYAYARGEMINVWTWKDVINNSGGTHVRLPLFYGIVDPITGAVSLNCWRLPPGGPYVDDSNVNARVTVVVCASRQASHPALVDTGNTTPPTSYSTTVITGAASAELAIPSTTAGDFSLAHGLPVTPSEAWIQITANGLIRFQPARYDATNVYLNASDDGLTGYVVFIYKANA